MISTKNLILFPHLPKTGGSSLANNIISKLKNETEYFRVAPKGRKDPQLNKQFETTLPFSSERLLLFGHGVSEGVFNYVEYEKLSIYTNLRHPLMRLVSHFNNMSNDQDNSKISFDSYLSEKINPSCLWYIRKFPSFIDDPFSSKLIQCLDIFSYFKDIYFVENSEKDFTRFMKIFEKKFDKNLNINIGGVDYIKRSKTETVYCESIYKNLNHDNSIYQLMQNYKSVFLNKKAVPKKTWKYNRWMMPVLNNAFWNGEDKDQIIKTIKGSVLESILQDQLNQTKINLHILLQSIYNINNFHSLTDDEQANILDLTNFAIKSKGRLKNKNGIPNSAIQEIILKSNRNMINDITKNINIWNELPCNNEFVIIGQINTSLASKNLSLSENYMIKYCKISPHKIQPFLKLGRFYSQYFPEKENEILKCAEKVLEFEQTNKWANNQLKKIIINK